MSLHSEQVLHINFVNWFRFEFPELADDLHHFANERKCSIQQGALLKRMAVTPGVYDLFLSFPLDPHSGFWLELKSPNGKLSQAQIDFGRKKIARGYYCAIARSLKEAKDETLLYLDDYIATRPLLDLKSSAIN